MPRSHYWLGQGHPSYFDYRMTQCELNNQVLHGAGIKVTVEVRIEYEWVAELEFDEDEV